VSNLTPEDFGNIVKLVCPHCAAGVVARKRASTGEWIHDRSHVTPHGSQFNHGLCWASRLRNSTYAPPDDPLNPHPTAA
jgi:hypothetical protein